MHSRKLKLYVLVYGQMSHWGATVITNLVTAVPYLGQAIAELTIIGKQNLYARKIKRIYNDSYYLNLPISFLAMFIGLIDSVGSICINNTSKGYIKISLNIILQINDLSLLLYIKDILKLGTISTYKTKNIEYCKYTISKTDLQEIIFPLFLAHNMYFLTEINIKQFNIAMYVFEKELTLIKDVPKNIYIKYKSDLNYKNLFYFKNWIVGFVITEGSFLKNKKYCYFILKPNNNLNLIIAIKSFFCDNMNLDFVISSKKDIQKVINFFSFEGNFPLLGLKLIQYESWLITLKNTSKYKKLNFPK